RRGFRRRALGRQGGGLRRVLLDLGPVLDLAVAHDDHARADGELRARHGDDLGRLVVREALLDLDATRAVRLDREHEVRAALAPPSGASSPEEPPSTATRRAGLDSTANTKYEPPSRRSARFGTTRASGCRSVTISRRTSIPGRRPIAPGSVGGSPTVTRNEPE